MFSLKKINYIYLFNILQVVDIEYENWGDGNVTESWLRKHVKVRSGSRACAVCDTVRRTSRAVMRHVMAAHYKYYPFK